MIGANKKRQFTKTALAAFLGAGMSSLAMSSAFAGGDIGGNCCADLEERVAELEATTVRKGNRKVSLRLSGQVNKMLMYWNDGHVSDSYVVDNIYSASRFKMDGSAKIRPGWSAGYVVEMEFDDAESTVVSQSNDDGGGTNGLLDLRHSYWWIKSDRYGTLSLGQTGHATYLITWMDTSGTGIISRDSKQLVGFSLQWRNATTNALTGTTFGSTHTSYFEGRGDVIRYDSPTVAGFKLSAAWGEDDVGDVALRFGRKLGDFQVVAGIGYAESTDTAGTDYDTVSGSFGAFHIPTGLNIHFAAGDRDVEGSALDRTYWYVKGGLKRKYNALGATAISVDYYSGDEIAATGGDSTQVGVQLVQSIDAAAMDIYFGWSHSEYDDATATVYDDIDMFMAGGIIKF